MLRGQSSKIADHFGVSPKTIRDVWAQRSWKMATSSMWEHDEILAKKGHHNEILVLAPHSGQKVWQPHFPELQRCAIGNVTDPFEADYDHDHYHDHYYDHYDHFSDVFD